MPIRQSDTTAGLGPRTGAGIGRTTGARRRDDAVARIEELIRTDELGPGDRLPGERRLAKRFNISRGSVREGIQFLATLGLLEVRHGGGTFLQVTPAKLNRLWANWQSWVAKNRDHILENFEVRMGAEAFAAELAARRARPKDLERLARAVQAMLSATEINDISAVIRCDLAFHDAVLQAAGNKTLRDMLLTLGEELIPSRAAVADQPGRAERSYQEHRAIYDAIRKGDGDEAFAAMRRHLESVQGDVLANLIDNDMDPADETAVARPSVEPTLTGGNVTRLWGKDERNDDS